MWIVSLQYLLNTNFAASQTMLPDQGCCDLDKYMKLFVQIQFANKTNTLFNTNPAKFGESTNLLCVCEQKSFHTLQISLFLLLTLLKLQGSPTQYWPHIQTAGLEALKCTSESWRGLELYFPFNQILNKRFLWKDMGGAGPEDNIFKPAHGLFERIILIIKSEIKPDGTRHSLLLIMNLEQWFLFWK